MAGMGQALLKKRRIEEDNSPVLFDGLFLKNVNQTKNNLVSAAQDIVKILRDSGTNVPIVTDRDTLLSTREVARMFGVSARTIERYRAENRIPHICISERVYKFRKADMLEYLNINYRQAKDYID